MATTKVSALSALTSPDGAEELLINDGGTSKKITITNVSKLNLKGGDLTSASPLVIDTDGNYFDVTGTTNFSAMTVAANRQFTLQFDGALTMTHHATNLDLPSEANITTAAGDVATFQSTGANTVQCINYTRADGTAVVSAGYTLPEATASAKGGIELFSDTDQSVAAESVSTTASRTYGLQLNSAGQGVVNVPWADTNTTYTVGDGGLTQINFTSADNTKLDAIEANATADQTAGEILTLLEDGIDSVHYKDASIDNEHLADDAVGIAELSATGTASSSNFLRGDNSWVTPTDTNTMGSGFTVSATTDTNATTITQGDDLMFTAGSGITCETTADGTVTISNVGYGKQTIWVPANAMTPTSSNGCATIAAVETTAGRPDMYVLDFDKDADEHAQFTVAFPKSWNLGTVTYQVFWSGLAASTGVTWGLQGVGMGDNTTIDVVYGTAITVDDDAQGAVEELLVSAESGAVTIAGTPADNDLTYFRIFRDVSAGNDDMAGDARLHGVKIFFTTDTINDA